MSSIVIFTMSQPRKPVYMAIVIIALSRRVSFDLSFSNAEAIIEISSSDRIAKFLRIFFNGGIMPQIRSHSSWQGNPLVECRTLLMLFWQL